MEHQQAALCKAIAAMSAFTDPEGNMPADTGEFRDLKKALSDCEAALLTMPDDALNRDDHQCCGKCEKPADTWLDRVKAEKADLDDRIDKLYAMLNSPKLPSLGMTDDALELLKAQRSAMQTYSDILAHRIRLAGVQ